MHPKNLNAKLVVLLSTFNGENFLESQLESLMNQINVNFDIIIRDDGSSDGTKQILKKYEHRVGITVTYGDHLGTTSSYMNLLRLALKEKKYRHFAYCDQDDIWVPENLSFKLKPLAETGIPQLTFSRQCYFGKKNGYYPKKGNYIVERLIFPFLENPIRGCTMLINRDLAELIVLCNSKNFVQYDFATYLIARLFGEISYVNHVGMGYRLHKNNSVGLRNFSKIAGLRFVALENSKVIQQAVEVLKIRNIKLNQVPVDLPLALLTGQHVSIVDRTHFLMKAGKIRRSKFESLIFKIFIFLKLYPQIL